uniref:Oleanolic acid 2-alpha-oxidase n=1 Tax=Centella asiatica TaxID=48106 RepID=A0A1I9Q5Y7_CENAS|nr:oleanolic acid 2-alpha-oxidase [Centella asiatica]AXG31530.1 triterpene C-2alpha hydroxylase [Centella asiatica]
MDLFLPLVFLSVILIVLIFKPRSDGDKKLPPGSFGWPIMGETIEFLFGHPKEFVDKRMKKYSPDIFKSNILGEKTAIICGPEGHKFLFSNEEKFFTVFRPHPIQRLFRSYNNKSAPDPPPSGAGSKDDVKSIKQPGFFKPEALSRFIGVIEATIQQHLRAHWEGKDTVEAYPLSKSLTLTLSCRFFLGIDNPERIARLVHMFDDITLGMHSIISNVPGTVFYRAKNAAAAVRKELLCVIKEKKQEMAAGKKAQDVLSHMISFSDPSTGKFMPELEVADKMMGLITAGYSTVATSMAFLMKFVGESPAIYNKIRAEQIELAESKNPGEPLTWVDIQKLKYSWQAMCETMRLVPPLQGTFREVINEFTYAGYTVPKGWKVYWTVSTVHMNPKYFPNPEKFDPSRYEEGKISTPYTYVPFGGGPRMCPGKEYARIAVLTFLHHVVRKYKWEVLFPDEKVIGDMMPAPEKGLPIRLHPH